MGFKLLKLPFLAQRDILGQMEFMELFDLSLMDANLGHAACTLQLPAYDFFPVISETRMAIHVGIPDRNNRNVKISFIIDKVPSKTMIRRWNGQRVQIKRSGKTFTLKSGKDQAENLGILENLNAHLTGILRLEGCQLLSELNVFDTKIFENLRSFYKVQLNRQDLTVKHAKFLLETLEIDDLTLHYTGPKCPKGPVDFELKHRIMELGNVDWLSFASILTMKCEILRIDRMNHMTQKDFSQFIRTWANRGIENLKEFACKVPYLWEFSDNRCTFLYRDDVYKSLEGMDLIVLKATRDGHQKTLQRKSDGQKAELIFMDHFKFEIVK